MHFNIVIIICTSLLLTACGLKGPLYLPKVEPTPTPIVVDQTNESKDTQETNEETDVSQANSSNQEQEVRIYVKKPLVGTGDAISAVDLTSDEDEALMQELQKESESDVETPKVSKEIN